MDSKDDGSFDHRRRPGESRIRRAGRVGRELKREPRAAFGMVRAAFFAVWARRGGGFYGLGYVVAFVTLQTQSLVGEWGESAGAVDFIASQALEVVFRISFMALANTVLALIWPIYVLEWLGGTWGIATLVAGYYLVEHAVRPAIERRWPEVRRAGVEAATKPERRPAQDDPEDTDKDGQRAGD